MVISRPESRILKRVYTSIFNSGVYLSLDIPDRVLERLYRNSRQSVRGRTEIEEFRYKRWTPSTEPASGRCPRAADERLRLSNHLTPE